MSSRYVGYDAERYFAECLRAFPAPALRLGGTGMAVVDRDLLAILVCPDTKASVVQVGDWLYSTDAESRRRYPIRDGIPIMLIDESQVVERAEYEKVMAEAGLR